MVDKSGGAESHRDPTPSGEDWGAAGVTDRAGQAGRVQRPLLACELIFLGFSPAYISIHGKSAKQSINSILLIN